MWCRYFSNAPEVVTILPRTWLFINLIIFWNFHFSPVSLTQDKTKRNLIAGNYHRGRLQLCAYATFSATVQTFPAVQVFCCLRVWTDRFCRFWEWWYFAVIKIPALICISGLRPTFLLTKSKNFGRFAILPGMDISFRKNALSREFRRRKILLIFHGFPWISVSTQKWMLRLELLFDTHLRSFWAQMWG